VDRYIMVMLDEAVKQVREDCENYDYVDANKVLMNLMTNELSSYYCDFTKDILYCDGQNDLRRRQVQSVYWTAVDKLVKLWAPFLVFTAEEVWQKFNNDEETSVHYTHFPEVENYPDAEELKRVFASLMDLRSAAMKALEESRNEDLIHSAQEAALTISCPDDLRALAQETLGSAAAQWMIVSRADFTAGEDTKVAVRRAEGVKCPRCWNYTEEADEEGLCPRCRRVLGK
jgi:isoleucyl-tRNA synthetase